MKIKLALAKEADRAVDVVITADSTARVEDVARALNSQDDQVRLPNPTLHVAPPGGEPFVLDPTLPLGDAPIGSGYEAIPVNATADSYRKGGSVRAIMTIRSGPNAGLKVPISLGSTVLGRTAPADIILDDLMVSRQHARLEVGTHIEIVDLNSANGVVIDGGFVQRARILPRQKILIGGTELTFTLIEGEIEETPADRVLERGGSLLFNRSPRVEQRYAGEQHKQPPIPTESEPRLFPWPMVVAPIIMGFALFSLTGRATSLIMVAMSPLMMLGNFIGQRTQQSKKLKDEVLAFETKMNELEDKLLEEEQIERTRRRLEAPATAQVYDQALRLGSLLWTRRPEHWNFLSLRLGAGRAKSRNSIEQNEDVRGVTKYVQRLSELRERFEEIDDVPLVEILPASGALGIAGPTELAADALRGLGVQVFGLHAPNEVVAAAILDPEWSRELHWLRWLPHVTSPQSDFAHIALADSQTAGTVLLNALEETILERLSGSPTHRGPLGEKDSAMQLGENVGESRSEKYKAAREVSLVLFVSNNAPVDRARLTQLIERGPDVGVYTVFVAPNIESLPAACRTYIDVSEGLDNATIGWVRLGKEQSSVKVEGVSRDYAEYFARCLAPVVDSSSVSPDSSDLPSQVSLLRVAGTDLAEDPSAVIERWQQNNSILDRSPGPKTRLTRASTLKAFVGQGATDAMTLDLRTQGPHALVGGTTGSGKSEFLQAWVLGLAAEYSPDRVTFLFVDYKGGSAFADCVKLPHCVGLVTDLSPHLVRRALTSLRAELRHREHLFNRKNAKDLIELEKRRDPEAPPALVLVIDEFAALANEVPEFVDGVVDIAQRGRSLGIHLIMATQRPAGVIKDNLRANTNLRVALRMADESDSSDVVGDPIAASFDPSLPGRAIAKTGPGRLVPFQSGYAGGWTTDAPDKVQVSVAELRFGTAVTWDADEPDDSKVDPSGEAGPNDQMRLVENFTRAAREARVPAPRRPWLDELSGSVDLVDLLDDPEAFDGALPIGIADVPEHQAQKTVYFSPDRDGHMLVYGTSGAGKTVALRSLGIGAGAGHTLGAASVYGVDFGTGALRSLEGLPHVGTVVMGDDVERIQRLFRTFRQALDARAQKFSAVNASTLREYRDLSGNREEPYMLLLLDGFGGFRNEWESGANRVETYATFMRMLGEGRPLGIHVVATADRYGAVPTAVSANITKRIVLRLADENSYGILGVPRDVLSERSVPGRGIVDGFETQVAVVGGTSNVAEQNSAALALGARFAAGGAKQAQSIGALPVAYASEDLPDRVAEMPTLGIGEHTLGPLGFEPVGTFVVAGPPQSGKTSALRSLLKAMLRFDPSTEVFHIGGRRAELVGERSWKARARRVDEVRALAKELTDVMLDETATTRMLVVVENLLEYSDTDADRALKELFQAANRSDHLVIADGDISQLGSGYGLVGELKASRHGIALKPETFDGDTLFKVPFPKVQRHEFPEGRGLFVENGKAVVVQMPLSE